MTSRAYYYTCRGRSHGNFLQVAVRPPARIGWFCSGVRATVSLSPPPALARTLVYCLRRALHPGLPVARSVTIFCCTPETGSRKRGTCPPAAANIFLFCIKLPILTDAISCTRLSHTLPAHTHVDPTANKNTRVVARWGFLRNVRFTTEIVVPSNTISVVQHLNFVRLIYLNTFINNRKFTLSRLTIKL